jgi:putative ABC transport system permease protein
MRFWQIVVHNVLRRRLRSLLTATAVAIAVGSVVALVGIAQGFRHAFLQFYEGADIDIVVTRSGSQRRLTSTLDERLADRIAALDDVQHVVPGLADVVSFPDENLFVVPVSGLVPGMRIFAHFRLTAGRGLVAGDRRKVMLGVELVESLNARVGGTLEVVEGESFDVVGVFESDNVLENGMIVMPLVDLQELMGREGQISGVSVTVKDECDTAALESLCERIRTLEPGLSVRTTQDHVESLTEIQIALAMAWLTSTVAIVIGTLGTLNTMFISIQERVREIGVLRALGWSRRLVTTMILGESLAISAAGGLCGEVAAWLFVRLLTGVPAVNGLIEGRIDPGVMLQGLIVAVVVGLIGGILPALAAGRLRPAEALRS